MTAVTAPAKPRLSPRKRRQRIRLAQYALLVVVALVAAFGANWTQIGHVFFDLGLARTTVAHGLGAALVHTITYTVGGFVLGLVVGTVLALMRLSDVAPYRWISTVYIEFFRGLPTLVVFIALSLLPLAFNGLVMPFDPYG